MKTKKIINSEYYFSFAKRSNNNINKGTSLPTNISIKVYCDWFSKNTTIYKNNLNGIKTAKKLFRDFVRSYRTICYLRNNANHSSGTIDIQKINKCIEELNQILKKIKDQSLPTASYDFYSYDELI